MTVEKIRSELLALQDLGYRAFMKKVIPTVDPERVVGVRTPKLRDLAKTLSGTENVDLFLGDLPHFYFEENQLHAFIIARIRDFGKCLDEVGRFLPYIDNWATCDQLSPAVFRKHRPELIGEIYRWLGTGKTYTVRFAVGMLMEHYLDDDFDPAYPESVAAIRSDEYYVRMMAAWYFATALAKRYDDVIPYIEQRRLDGWTHNKTIQKAIESYRITPEQKTYLRSLKTRG